MDELIRSCAHVMVWRSGCNASWDPDTAAGHDAGFESLLSAVGQHHGDALRSSCERERSGFAAASAKLGQCFDGKL